MVQNISPDTIEGFSDAEKTKVTKKDYVIELQDTPVKTAGKAINLFSQTTSKRESSFSSLVRLCQNWLVEGENVFNNYVVFDLETTGRDSETCAIVEIAAVKVSNRQISDSFQTLVNPQIPIEQEAIDVHHISENDVLQAPVIADVWPRFVKFIGKNILIAHNGYNFDFKIIDRFAQQIGGSKLANVRYDSLIFARQLYPNDRNSIDALSEKFKLDPGNRHRALDDVKVLHEIFQKMLKEFYENQKKVTADFLFEYCALANYLDNKLYCFEDKVFFLAGVQKLLSPYSKIFDDYCHKFAKDNDTFAAQITEKARQLYPEIVLYDNSDDFRNKILAIAREFNSLPIDQAIAEFLSTIMLINPQDKLAHADAVSLLTFHSAKGLEFQKVIIVGMEDDNMPNFFAYKNDDYDDRSLQKKMDEQKRLLYVGLTRAKDEIILSAVKNRFGRQQKSSPFLREILKYMKENV
jgi:DNA polymerase III epsilon subunit family exonuclease